ncbi:MAG: hypothetical protein ACI9QN_001742, partial [Arcticibacterium sp.]
DLRLFDPANYKKVLEKIEEINSFLLTYSALPKERVKVRKLIFLRASFIFSIKPFT